MVAEVLGVVYFKEFFTAEAQRLRGDSQSFFEMMEQTEITKHTECNNSLRELCGSLRLCGERTLVSL
jgi:hypothetical protein